MTRHRPGFYVLGFAAAILLAGILINMITATLPQPAAEATGSATTDLETRVATLEDGQALHLEELRVHEDHILALEDRAARLEGAIELHLEELKVHEEHILALEALQWNEPGKVNQAVVDRLWERASSCQNNDACYHGDPLLYAFYSIPYDQRHDYVTNLIVEGTFYATQTDPAHWAVSAQLGEDEPFIFLVDTTYHAICWDQSQFCAAVDFTKIQ